MTPDILTTTLALALAPHAEAALDRGPQPRLVEWTDEAAFRPVEDAVEYREKWRGGKLALMPFLVPERAISYSDGAPLVGVASYAEARGPGFEPTPTLPPLCCGGGGYAPSPEHPPEPPAPAPLPMPGWLLLAALSGLTFITKRRKT